MYAKFVIYDEGTTFGNNKGVSDRDGNAIQKVVPSTIQMFEGRRISYRKIFAETIKDFTDISSELCCYSLLTNLPFDENSFTPFEFILTSIYETENYDVEPTNYIAAADTVLFIMNNDGKTIDKIACRNNN